MAIDSAHRQTVDCPNCGTTVEWTTAHRWRPFCSERCKLIDLGDWLDGSNAIAGEATGSTEETGS